MKLGIEELSIIVEGLRLRVKQLSSSVSEINQSIENLETEDGTKAPAIMQTTSPAAIASFADGGEDMPIKSLKCTIVPVQEGTGDPAPDNVRPITGWNGVNVQRTGVNIWDEEWEVGGIDSATGANTGNTDRIRSKNYISVKSGETYYIKGALNLRLYDESKIFISSVTKSDTTYQIPDGVGYIRFVLSANYGTTYNNDISINYPSTDTDYHASHVDSHSLTFPTEAGTVYGGYIDVTNGKLHVTHKCITLQNVKYLSSQYAGSIFYNNSCPETADANFRKPIISNRLKYVGNTFTQFVYGTCVNGNTTSFNLWVSETAFSTTSDAETWLANNPTQILYELAQEIVYDIDPVTITTLLGYNNIYCDTGTVEVVYTADTKMYIDNAVASVTPEPEPEPSPDQDDAPPEEEEEEEAEPAPEEDIAEPAEGVEEEAEPAEAVEEEAEPVVKKTTRKK